MQNLHRLAILGTLLIAEPLEGQQCCGSVDRALLVGSSAAIAVDWLQTIDGLRRGRRESNPLLGPHPSLGKANLLIGAALLANGSAVLLKRRDLRWFIWASVLVLEVDAILTNHKAGLRLSFQF